ncbi:MAG: phytase [Prolixibacteraceae bacterium]|nr:phytase [Prolixibacteraceae bacterium]
MKLKELNSYFNLVVIALLFLASACKNRDDKPIPRDPNVKLSVTASAETTPVLSYYNEDAADDPAIWVNQTAPEKSLIVGTNKKLGLSVYNLNGDEIYYGEVGRINNVDIREIYSGSEKIVLVAGSNRTNNTIALYKLDTISGKLHSLNNMGLKTNLVEVYGFCLYQNSELNKTYAFINGKSGFIEQWLLSPVNSDSLTGEKIRTLKINSQPEGMVADDELNVLFVGEEDRGIWKFSALEDDPVNPVFLENSGEENSMIKYDIEGLSIYYHAKGKGYLIASSQGNYSYAVFNRDGNNEYLFSFFIDDGDFDGVEETDGIEVTSQFLGELYPKGAFIVQDGFNFNNDTLSNQNFKIIDWQQIEELIKVP